MDLIAILLALTLERLLGALEGLRNYRWFSRWCSWAEEQLPTEAPWRGVPGGIVLLLPPLLLAALLLYAVANLGAIVSFIVGVMVLLYCLGPRDLEAEVEAFIAARQRDDEEAAMWHARVLLGNELPSNSRALTRALTENILVEANTRLIAVLFWFALLGPLAALFYRLVTLLQARTSEEGRLQEVLCELRWVLDWVPARLCAAGYALSGNFVDAVQSWRDAASGYSDSNRGVMVASGIGALGHQESGSDDEEVFPERETARVDETLALVRRMVLVWLVVLALMTLAGIAN